MTHHADCLFLRSSSLGIGVPCENYEHSKEGVYSMFMRSFKAALSLAAILLVLGGSASQAEEKNVTTVTVEDMTCGGCAKKVQQYVAKVSGVEKVEPDAKTHTVKVFPKANTKVSSKALWEAIEKAGYTPSKLDGPSGSFKEKPAA